MLRGYRVSVPHSVSMAGKWFDFKGLELRGKQAKADRGIVEPLHESHHSQLQAT